CITMETICDAANISSNDRYNNTVYKRWVIYFVVYKLTNLLWLSRRNLASLRKFLSQDAISCLGALEVSFLVISLFGYSNWMCDVRLRQRTMYLSMSLPLFNTVPWQTRQVMPFTNSATQEAKSRPMCLM
ncbi:hypothetical protein SO802_020674, partial [Lithocarpus litseifolius]